MTVIILEVSMGNCKLQSEKYFSHWNFKVLIRFPLEKQNTMFQLGKKKSSNGNKFSYQGKHLFFLCQFFSSYGETFLPLGQLFFLNRNDFSFDWNTYFTMDTFFFYFKHFNCCKSGLSEYSCVCLRKKIWNVSIVKKR